MAITSGLFNSKNGDRVYDAIWFARYFATFIGNGVFPNPSTGLQVMADTNMDVYVRPGDGWINGYFIVNDSNYSLHLDPADGVLKRIDRIVMRLDYDARIINIVVKKGIPASSPVAPALQRDINYHELALADITIDNGVTDISQGNISDTRLNNELCGIVHGVVDQVDTTTIFNQYKDWFSQKVSSDNVLVSDWMVSKESEFNNWFANIQDVLDGDVAANLSNQITTVHQDLVEHKTNLASQASGKGASLIGINDSGNLITATTVEGALAEVMTKANSAFQSASDGKIQIANAITGKGQIASGIDTFAQLATAIGNINTGKKWASGTVTSSSTDSTFEFAGSTSVYNCASATVIGLSFKPNLIILYGYSTYHYYTIYNNYISNPVYNPNVFFLSLNYQSFGTNSYNFKGDKRSASVTNTSFVLPVALSSSSYNWIAFE